jgi:metallo-beta-lactamase class B
MGHLASPTRGSRADGRYGSSHVAAANQAAGQDLRAPFRRCPGAPQPADPANTTAEPTKVFDNLYFIGIPAVSAWAITISAGIIIIDSLNNAREAETFVEGGLRKLGLDPAQAKYVLITHAHTDHCGGAQYLADKLHDAIGDERDRLGLPRHAAAEHQPESRADPQTRHVTYAWRHIDRDL